MQGNQTSAAVLREEIVCMERLDESIADVKEQIAALNERIKGFKGERRAHMKNLKAAGFDPPAVEQMIRERKMIPEERRAYQARLQLYRGMLGMLDGTPLGDAARSAFEAKHRPEEPDETRHTEVDSEDPSEKRPTPSKRPKPAAKEPEVPEPPKRQRPTAESVAGARAQGAQAARDGITLDENPYPATDEAHRAAWDEGWCSELGSDGMDIPDEFRRPDDKADGKDSKNPKDDSGDAA